MDRLSERIRPVSCLGGGVDESKHLLLHTTPKNFTFRYHQFEIIVTYIQLLPYMEPFQN